MSTAGRISKADVDWYLTRGKRLCLLDSGAGLPPNLRGKKPLRKDWPTRDESAKSLHAHAKAGGNIGFVIGKGDLIIDVDPRNGGNEGLKVLESDLGGVALTEICPTVETGGGGLHIYCSKNPGEEIRKKSVRYAGIDFLTEGAHVVIPGSYHFLSGKFYDWDCLSATDERIFPPCPEAIMRHIRKVRDPDEPLHRSAVSPRLTDAELADLLAQIDPTDYRGQHDDWLSLMFAAHHATAGEGRRAFVDWCVRDKKYAGEEGMILYRWDTVLDDEENLVTYRTLMKAVRDAGGEVPDDVDRKCKVADFDPVEFTAISNFDDVVEALDEDDDDLGPADDAERAEYYAKIEETRKKVGETKYEAVMLTVSGLTNETVSDAKLDKIAKLCKGFDNVSVEKIQAAICRYTKLNPRAVKAAFVRCRRDEQKREAFANIQSDVLAQLEGFTGDVVPIAVAMLLKKRFRHGHTICLGHDGDVWTYDGKYWQPLEKNQVDNLCLEAMTLADPNTADASKNMLKCRHVLTSVLRKIDFTAPPEGDFDIFNFQNCEVWVDIKTGKCTKKLHDFKSRQSTLLGYGYDANATCPSFSAALPDILSCYGDNARDIERHIWELYGYTLTRRKNQAAFIAITGGGGNGKTIILDALKSVAGPMILPGSLRDFGTGRSAHAFSQLVGKLAFIDDDAEYGSKLPNEVLKKVSETKLLTANPKYKREFAFESNAICWLASNSWPYTGDSSNGIRRRAHVLELTNEYIPGVNADTTLPEKVKKEAPGLFNRMIAGLARFRKRGFFNLPAAMAATAVTWETRTNPVMAFLVDREIENGTMKVGEMFSDYREYAFETGRGEKISQPRFKEMLESLGCKFNPEQCVLMPERILKK